MRARMLDLHWKTKQHLSLLKRHSEQDGHYRVSKRIHAILLNSDGYTSGEISNFLSVPRSCVTDWLSSYEQFGIEGILEGHRCGRPRELNEKQLVSLNDIVESGPVAYGYSSGVWTAKMVNRIILDEFEVEYHPNHVWKILDKIGLSLQRPRKILAAADAYKQDRWRRYTFPRLKKKRGKKELL